MPAPVGAPQPAAANGAAKPAAPAAAAPAQRAQPDVVLPTIKRSSDIQPARFLHLMVLGFGKCGKTTATVSTAPGPVLVINSDDPDESLEPARDFTDEEFLHMDAHSPAEMSGAIIEAHRLVKAGEVATVIWDTISGFSPFCEAAAFKATKTTAGKEDGRKASPVYKKTMRSFVQRLKALPCHLIVNSHYIDVGSSDEDEQQGVDKVWDRKSPQGIVPNLYGSFRAEICGMFSDIVFMEKIPMPGGREERIFVTGINGVYGPGCRSIAGNKQLPADIGVFLEMKRTRGATLKPAPTRAPMPAVVATQPRPAAPATPQRPVVSTQRPAAVPQRPVAQPVRSGAPR